MINSFLTVTGNIGDTPLPHLLLLSVHGSTMSKLQKEMSPSLRQVYRWDAPLSFNTPGKKQALPTRSHYL